MPALKVSLLSGAKLKKGILICPNIRELIKDKEFERRMTTKGKEGWITFTDVVRKFLDNQKDPGYKLIVINMLDDFKLTK